MRSWEDSLQRLSLNSIDLLLIHDLDSFFHDSEQRFSAHVDRLITSGWRALDELRSQGIIKAVGAGLNRMGAMPRLLDAVDLDFCIIAMPYTLLDQEVLDEEFPLCEERDVRIVIGSVFASGILASGPVEGARYAYDTASPEILDKTRRIQEICQRHNVPLPAAAMQFPLANPLVAAIIPGAMEPGHIETNAGWFQHEIPSDLWAELKDQKLLRQDAPTP
jgi:D-threo-aldose 1-dehydrogenase